MMKTLKTTVDTFDLDAINAELRSKTPSEITAWALSIAKRPILTTNFRPLAATILHLVTKQSPNIPVIWCDTGYNTPNTYRHALRTIERLNLSMDIFSPVTTRAYRDVVLGIPEIDTPNHDNFTYQVKLEPFSRAMSKHKPDVWFANLRKDQSDFRSSLDIVSLTKDGVLKVCPFFYWTEVQLNNYLEFNELESEANYYDPTKALANRECGLHT